MEVTSDAWASEKQHEDWKRVEEFRDDLEELIRKVAEENLLNLPFDWTMDAWN